MTVKIILDYKSPRGQQGWWNDPILISCTILIIKVFKRIVRNFLSCFMMKSISFYYRVLQSNEIILILTFAVKTIKVAKPIYASLRVPSYFQFYRRVDLNTYIPVGNLRSTCSLIWPSLVSWIFLDVSSLTFPFLQCWYCNNQRWDT